MEKDKESYDFIECQQYRRKKEEMWETRRFNAASISVYVRKLIAREWARALKKR